MSLVGKAFRLAVAERTVKQASNQNEKERVPGRSLRPRASRPANYTGGFLKLRLYVYKCIISARRKVLRRLRLQLFSRKWRAVQTFRRNEVAF
jgi:hypothetical protein